MKKTNTAILYRYLTLKNLYFGILLWVAIDSGIIPIIKHSHAWANVDKFTSDTLINIRITESTLGKGSSWIYQGFLKSNPLIILRGETSQTHKVQILNYWTYHIKYLPIWYLEPNYMVIKPYYTTSNGDFLPYIPKSHFYGSILGSLTYLLPFIISYLIYVKFIKDL